MQKPQIDIILFSSIIIEIFHHNWRNLHNGSNTKLLQVFLRLMRNNFHLLLFTTDDLPQTRTSLGLLFRMKVFKNIQKDIFHFLIWLTVHYVVPIWIFYLLLTYLSVRLSYTFLQLQEIFIKLLTHRIIAYWVYNTL